MKEKDTIITKRYSNVVLEIRTDRSYRMKDGSYKIILRAYHNRRYANISTGHHTTGEGIDADTYEALDTMLRRVFDRCRPLIDEGSFSLDVVKGFASDRTICSTTLNELVRERINRMESNGQRGTVTHWKGMLKKLDDSCGQIRLSDVNSVRLKPMVEAIRSKSKATQEIYLNDLRAVINEAIYKEYLKPSQNPFKISRYDTSDTKIVIPKGRKRTEMYLTQEEMRKIYEYHREKPSKATGMFLLSYLLGGMNYADMLRLRFDDHWKNTDGRELAFIRKKTERVNSFTVRLAVTDKVREIMDSIGIDDSEGNFLFPQIYSDNDQQMYDNILSERYKRGVQLKRICRRIGIGKDISPTYARHSFATIANRLQLPYSWIEYAMAHSNQNISSHYMGGYSTDQLIEFTEKLL